jgi:hypothetical protein
MWARVLGLWELAKQLFQLFDGQVEDGLVPEDFFGFGFLDCEALASLATTGVFVRGFGGDGFA